MAWISNVAIAKASPVKISETTTRGIRGTTATGYYMTALVCRARVIFVSIVGGGISACTVNVFGGSDEVIGIVFLLSLILGIVTIAYELNKAKKQYLISNSTEKQYL